MFKLPVRPERPFYIRSDCIEKRKYIKRSDEYKSEIINRYRNGESISKIAKAENISYGIIQSWLFLSGDISRNSVKHKTLETGKKVQKYTIHDTYAEIPINHKSTYIMAKIDIDDIEKCQSYYWSYSNGYAYCNMLMQSMHRYIMNADSGVSVDHINHDTFDNRKCNLRLTNQTQQNMNQPVHQNNKLGIRGVIYDESHKKYAAYISAYGEHKLVRFNNIDDAITWRSNKEAELFGEYNYKEQ